MPFLARNAVGYPRNLLVVWIPSRPWSKISVDLFTLDGQQYLVMVDHYSDYFELEPLRNVAASTVIRAMKRNFARHGIPDTCISDNGPQFDCHEFSRFARDYGFALVKSSPYHSRGNGKAESAVKIAKNILKKSRQEDPYIALLAYRNTPQQGHVYSPAQRLMSRRLRDLIPMATSKLQPQLTVPSVVTQNIAKCQSLSNKLDMLIYCTLQMHVKQATYANELHVNVQH